MVIIRNNFMYQAVEGIVWVFFRRYSYFWFVCQKWNFILYNDKLNFFKPRMEDPNDSGSNFYLGYSIKLLSCYKKKTGPEKAALKAITKDSLKLSTNEVTLASFNRLASRRETCPMADIKLWE